MVSHITTAGVAPQRARLREGALLACGASTALPREVGTVRPRPRITEMAAASLAAAGSAVARPRPQVSGGEFSRRRAHVADQANPAMKQPTSQQYAIMTTRFAAIGGGAMGPHPARDPV